LKICVIGDGLYSSGLAAKLARTEAELSLILPDALDTPHLVAIQDKGLTLIEGDSYVNLDLIASDTTAFLGPQNVVFVLPGEGTFDPALLVPLISDATLVLEARSNSISGRALPVKVDIEVEPLAPGVIRHVAGETVIVDGMTAALTQLQALLEEAGLSLLSQ